MTWSMRSTVLLLAVTLVGLAGCRHSANLYSHPGQHGIESCPDGEYPSDVHPAAPPTAYFHGPLTSKTQTPAEAAPSVPAQSPEVDNGPESRPDAQELEQDGALPEEDDSTADM